MTYDCGEVVAQPRRHQRCLVALLLILAWAPLPLGSNREWSLALLCAAIMLIAGVVALGYVASPYRVPESMRRYRIPILVLVLWAAFPLLQLVSPPAELAAYSGLDVQRAYQGLKPVAGEVTSYLTIDRDSTARALLRQSALVGLFVIVLVVVDRLSRLKLLLGVMFVAGAAQALYGLLVYLGGSEAGLWTPRISTQAITGTYVNQNHFAGLIEITLPVGLGFAFAALSSSQATFGPGVRMLLSQLMSRQALILFGVFLMLAALILTGSRGALASLLIGILAALAIGYRARHPGDPALRLVVLLGAMIVGVLLWFGSGALGGKLDRLGDAGDRAALREVSYELIGRNPLSGTGAGTYRWIFPAFKDERFGSGFYEHAHNDFLEILVEQGVVGFILVSIPVLLLLFAIARAYRRRHDLIARGAMFATLTGCISLLVHGLVDFNLQIPANAAYFSCLLAAGAAASVLPSPSSDVETVSSARLAGGPRSERPRRLSHPIRNAW